MPAYAGDFRQQVTNALTLAEAGEKAAISSAKAEWRKARVEYLYELAFLRTFIEWEIFLEQTFLRYLCGFQSVHGRYVPTSGRYCKSLSQAQSLIFGRRHFALWHDPTTIANRARQHLARCPHELVIQSHAPRLEHFAAVRHRIAHGQDDAKQKFNTATMMICGRRYPGSRPGRFLRDRDSTTMPPQRWIEVLASELIGLAGQIG